MRAFPAQHHHRVLQVEARFIMPIISKKNEASAELFTLIRWLTSRFTFSGHWPRKVPQNEGS
jgi:hypothetical protein